MRDVEQAIERTIYLSGPYTKYDPGANVNMAARMAIMLEQRGWTVLVPHATHLRHLITPMPYEYWIEQDLKLLELAGAFTRFSPQIPSKGADRELMRANELGLKIYPRIEDVPDMRVRV